LSNNNANPASKRPDVVTAAMSSLKINRVFNFFFGDPFHPGDDVQVALTKSGARPGILIGVVEKKYLVMIENVFYRVPRSMLLVEAAKS